MIRKEMFTGKSLEEVADIMAGGQPGSDYDHLARVQFMLLQTKAQIEATKHTKKYTQYMLWSVIVLAFSSFGTLVFSFLNYIQNNN